MIASVRHRVGKGEQKSQAAPINRHRRNRELVLLLLVAAITIGAWMLASLGRLASLPANITPFLAMVLALLVVAHVATRRLVPMADGLLLPLAALLNGLGYVMIARLDEDLAVAQATWVMVGIGAFIATLVVVRRTKWLVQYRYTLMLAGLTLLMLPLLPGLGQQINGARIWVKLGPVNFQPGEFAKVALALFFAAYLEEKREVLSSSSRKVFGMALPEPRHLGPVMLAWGVSLLVMMAQKDLGSSLLFFALFVVMLWVATERPSYLLVAGALFAAGATFAWSQFAHVQDRVEIWLDPWKTPQDEGFQVIQSAFALADGGLTGVGLGVGSPDNIPEVETDFIFAALGEELGLVGCTAVLLAYLLMIGSGLRAALLAEAHFDKLLATGLTALLGIQAFIIIGGVTRVLPLTGVTLPFVSYGGSSLLANYVMLALLLRISDTTNRNQALVAQAEQRELDLVS